MTHGIRYRGLMTKQDR
ncbi:CRISPR-associated DxTHG motif protein [Rhizobium laguerreae]|nr:CRISPR-associated DxTHG motif protein [Rhizobium laguerreae]